MAISHRRATGAKSEDTSRLSVGIDIQGVLEELIANANDGSGKTSAEWSQEWGVGDTKVRRLLKAGLDAGRIVRGTRMVETIAGARKPVPVYSVKE